ncbi:MAG: hypothetical protein H8E37_13440 [Planctomycetes bacterium]|nr:hypothetical protein [Planctomycetota bacterium]
MGKRFDTFDLPLMEELWSVAEGIPSDLLKNRTSPASNLGIYFADSIEEFREPDDWCIPENAVTFATTGGDGHFSFLVQNRRIDSSSPVIVTAGANGDDANWILAESFEDFLRIGFSRSFFALEQFVFAPATALKAYADPHWQPGQRERSCGYIVSEERRRVMDFVFEQLDLTPLAHTVEEFNALQARYIPLLEMLEEYWDVTCVYPDDPRELCVPSVVT